MKLNEKASIDWNNYLKPEEVRRFLAKDDKVESAENIVYDNEFKDRFQEFKKSGWTKRELTQDLANFYENGNLNEEFSYLDEAIVDKKTFGRKVKNVSKYFKQIQNVFNELKKYGINMAPDPINQRPNTVTYVGQDQNGNRIMIDFNTNHRDFEEDGGNQVFSNVFFGMRGAKAGSYNVENSSETAEQIVNTLREIGFKTQEEINQAKQNEIKAKEDAEKAEEAKIKAAREKKKQDQEIIDYNKNIDKEPEEEPEEQDDEDRLPSQEEFPEVLDECLAELTKRGEINSSIHLKYTGEKEFSIDCFYVSANQYFVKSDDIELDELMKTKDMITYLTNLSNKYRVASCSTYTAPGDKTPEKGLSLHLFQ